MSNSNQVIAETLVWCVGSSIVKKAFCAARERPGGINLGLDRKGMSIWWQFKGGMVWADLYPKLRHLVRISDLPRFLIIHCGANDVGMEKETRELIGAMKTTIEKIKLLMPSVTVVWSQMLPRKSWWYAEDVVAMNKCVRRINSAIAAYVVREGGCYIKYPDLKIEDELLFEKDGVHLSNVGNDILLNTISAAIEQFYNGETSVYPDLY